HEYGHGVSTRLTGGPADANSLDNLQSAGMGEGWSDFWALAFTQKAADTANTPRLIADYVVPNAGVRRQPYSRDLNVHPTPIASFNGGFPNNEAHNVGEIWASALWDMYWNLIDKYGYSPDLYHGNAGNNIALQLVMDGLKMQPSNPTFAQARDAI